MTTTELVVYRDKMKERFLRLMERFERIKTVDDIEREILKGMGLAKNTYRTYMRAIRVFYDWRRELYGDKPHPLIVDPGDIENFYDYRTEHGADIQTVYLDIQALKKMFEAVKMRFSVWDSPFDSMPEKLWEKLHKGKKGEQKRAMTLPELKDTLAYLKAKIDPLGKRDYAMFFFLVTSGLRASEALELTWGDIWKVDDDSYYCRLQHTKSGEEQDQELLADAVEAVRAEFKRRFKRNPKGTDRLFYTYPSYPGDETKPLQYHVLYRRFMAMGEDLKARGIIRKYLEFSPHMARRTYGTTLSNKIPAHQVQGKLRHKSLDTTLNHYLDKKRKVSDIWKELLSVA